MSQEERKVMRKRNKVIALAAIVCSAPVQAEPCAEWSQDDKCDKPQQQNTTHHGVAAGHGGYVNSHPWIYRGANAQAPRPSFRQRFFAYFRGGFGRTGASHAAAAHGAAGAGHGGGAGG